MEENIWSNADLVNLYDTISEEYKKLANTGYDNDKLCGYKDALWDLHLILNQNYGVTTGT